MLRKNLQVILKSAVFLLDCCILVLPKDKARESARSESRLRPVG